MSDLPNGAAAAAPDSGAAPAEAPVTEKDVASVLVGMLDRDSDGDDIESSEASEQLEADDVGADESPPTGDEPEGEIEEPADTSAAPIELPTGWNGEDRKTWQTLPPAAQEIIRRRDSEMAGVVTRATQERAEVERVATQRLEQAIQDRRQYSENLAVFEKLIAPRMEEYRGLNWQQLAAENPAEYVRKSAEANATQQQLGWIYQEAQRVQQRHSYELAQQIEQEKRMAHSRLVEARPEFADPQRAQEIGSRLGQFLRTQGFADQEIIDCRDDRAIKLALKAMEAEERVSNVAKANAKRTPAPPPQVQRPGSSRPASNSNRMTQLAQRFDSTPSVENAARIVAQWLQ